MSGDTLHHQIRWNVKKSFLKAIHNLGPRKIHFKNLININTFANYLGLKEGCTVWIRPKQAIVLKICANKTGSSFSGSIFIISSTYL
jgi:hypothetical protein